MNAKEIFHLRNTNCKARYAIERRTHFFIKKILINCICMNVNMLRNIQHTIYKCETLYDIARRNKKNRSQTGDNIEMAIKIIEPIWIKQAYE